MRRRSLALAVALTASVLASAPVANAACSGENEVVTNSNLAASEAAMVCLVNEYRQSNGRSSLAVDSRLTAAARAHSQDMVARNFFSHDTPEGLDPFTRIVAAGYPSNASTGENIGLETGAATPKSLFEGFRASSPHDQNMLSGDWRDIGVGFAVPVPPSYGNSGSTVTQTFGGGGGDGGDGVGDGGSGACPRVVTLQARVVALKQRVNESSGDQRKKAKRALKKVKQKLRAARAACG